MLFKEKYGFLNVKFGIINRNIICFIEKSVRIGKEKGYIFDIKIDVRSMKVIISMVFV